MPPTTQPGSARAPRIRTFTLAAYALTCLLPVLQGWAGGFLLGGLSRTLSWPYPLLLPLKPLFDRLAPLDIVAADGLGAVGVYGLGRYLEHLAGKQGENPLVRILIGVVCWPFFLAVVNGLLYMTGIGIFSRIGE